MEEAGKEFLEAFPNLEVQGELKDLLSTMEVVRVTMNRRKDLLRIYTVSSQWIHKKYIYKLEEMIRNQLFSHAPIRVKIIEKFISPASIPRSGCWRSTTPAFFWN